MRTTFMRGVVCAVLWGLGAAAVPGCNQGSCSAAGATRCGAMGNDIETCEWNVEGNALTWQSSESCGTGFCVRSQTLAKVFCAATPTPVAACSSDGPACSQNTPIQCESGFATAANSPCGAWTCTVTDDRSCSFCLPPDAAAVPDGVCASGGGTAPTTCANNVVYDCTCGLRLNPITDCADTGACETFGGTSFCALSDAGDPLCQSTSIPHGIHPQLAPAGNGSAQYCEDGMLVACVGDYPVKEAPCARCLMGTCDDFGGADASGQDD
jgi:hypothetical protein